MQFWLFNNSFSFLKTKCKFYLFLLFQQIDIILEIKHIMLSSDSALVSTSHFLCIHNEGRRLFCFSFNLKQFLILGKINLKGKDFLYLMKKLLVLEAGFF